MNSHEQKLTIKHEESLGIPCLPTGRLKTYYNKPFSEEITEKTMARKLNRKAAEAYTEDFSDKVLDDFFSDRQAAVGHDILELTPVQQVNLLIIQRLYQRWQEETMNLRSPYFNFEHPEVQESLQHFMNTLSRHILVERHALEPFLKSAVMDTLRLLFNPMAYFDELLRLYRKPKAIQASLRYLRMQQPLIEILQEQIEGKETKEPEYLLAILEASIRSGKLAAEPLEEHVQAFAQILPLPQEIADEPIETPPPPSAKETPADNTNFFSSISQMTSKPARPASQEAAAAKPSTSGRPAPAPTVRVSSISESQSAPPAYTPAAKAQPKPAAPVPGPQPEPVAERKTSPVVVLPQKKEETGSNLNTRFERSEKKPLYEKFEPREARTSSLPQKQRSANIRNYISLNQRFMFIKELFNNDAADFSSALNALDDCQNLSEARQWLQGHLAQNRQIQPDSDVVQEFDLVLEQRFGN